LVSRTDAALYIPTGWQRIAVVAMCCGTLMFGAALALSGDPGHLAFAALAGLLVLAGVCASPRWALVVAVFALVSYTADTAPGVAGRLASTGIVVVLFLGTLLRAALDRTPLRLPRVTAWFLAYIAGLTITTALATDHSAASKQLFDAIGFSALVVLVVALLTTPEWVRRLAWSITAALGALAILAVLQQATKAYGTSFAGLSHVEVDGGLVRSGGPLSANYFGQMLAAGCALAVYLALAARSLSPRLGALGLAGACFVAMLYTYSRGALLGLVAGALVAVVLRRVRLKYLVVGAIAAVLVVAFVLPPQISDRIGALAHITSPTAGSTDPSLRGRTSENLAAIEMFRAHPLQGVGPGNYERNYLTYSTRIGIDDRAEDRSAHSLYLEALAETGLIGSVPFFALLGYALWRPLKARRRLDRECAFLAEGAFVALVTFLVTAATLHNAYPRHMWVFIALALAAGELTGTRARPERAGVT
jgi:O-antigen ligase